MNILMLLLLIVKSVSSSKILAVTIFPTYSHQGVYQPLWIELAERGHEVTLITSHLINNASLTNLKEINYSAYIDIFKNANTKAKDGSFQTLGYAYFPAFEKIAEKIFTMSEVKDLLKNSKFDLVISEWIYPAIFGFSAFFKCPLIGINSIELIDPLSVTIGRPIHPIMHPMFVLPFKAPKNFWERLQSVHCYLWFKYFFYYYVYPGSNKLIHKYLGEDLPTVEEIIKNVSFVFINTNFLFFRPRINPPNVIEFSGLHMKPPKPLPQEIQTFLDESINGVVYFSLGSNIKSHLVPIEIRNIILDTFKELPYNVLWKFEDNNFTIPQNVKVCEWLPQQDILVHKNIKVFITQGGLQSSEEAIRKRVPLVGLPFVLDQTANVKRMVDLGIAKLVDKSVITVEKFKEAIVEVAENRTYRNKISKIADILEDEPIKAIDKIMWAIEHVLRNKKTQYFPNPYPDCPWFHYFFLDIFAFVIACIIIIILFIKYLLYIVLKIEKIKRKDE